MHSHLTLMAIGLALSVGSAQAQVLKAAPQLDKVAMCEKAAGTKTGNERKSFINTCMAAKSEAQPGKMASCDHASRAEDL